MLGLWVILGIAMLFGAGLLALQWFRVRAERKLQDSTPIANGLGHVLSRSTHRSHTAAAKRGSTARPGSAELGGGGGAK